MGTAVISVGVAMQFPINIIQAALGLMLLVTGIVKRLEKRDSEPK